MGVARAGDVLGRGAVLDGEGRLVDLLAGRGTHDVRAQDAVRVLVDQDLDQTLRRRHRAGPAVGHHREHALAVLDARRLQLLLRLPDRRHLRVRVDHARDRVVVDVSVLSRQKLRARNALLLGLVREHGPCDAVADRVHAFHLGLEVLPRHDPLRLVELDTDGLEVHVLGARPPTDRHQHAVRLKLRVFAVGFECESDAVRADVGGLDLGLELEGELEVLFQ
mmetsp:Transcript_21268/g.42915  ORF Transcript_21268/g.42915 Transcript_21268/m.42915 type:complete len:222 (-) Transcript_21268:800-1465(-)